MVQYDKLENYNILTNMIKARIKYNHNNNKV